MKRKDCDKKITRAYRATRMLCPLLFGAVAAAPADAGTVRLRASAVVVANEMRLVDVCDLGGFDPRTETQAAAIVLGASPAEGHTVSIQMETVRGALSRIGMNMADVTFGGAMQCLVSRPAVRAVSSPATYRASARSNTPRLMDTEGASRTESTGAASRTLRDAVYEHFTKELERYHGRPDIVFDRGDAETLGLLAHDQAFTVRTRNEVPLGLVQVEIDVVVDGKVDRTISLAVNVSMLREVFVARRAINQGVTLAATDIERRSLSFNRVGGRLGVVDSNRIIGKRAKRFMALGSVIRMDLLELVPLVHRGQLVRLTSRAGGIHIVTSGKAMQGGMLGETITVRAVDRGRLQFEATIVGAGAVEVGYTPLSTVALATRQGGES